MKHGILVTCTIGLLIAVGAYGQDGSTNAPPVAHRPMRPMMDSLLGPRILDELALTGDQQTKYNSLNASFKSDVAKWRANHPSGGASTNAAPGAAREELRQLRHGYIEKLRAVLTADQNTKLTQWLENGPRERHGGGPSAGGNPPPPPQSGGNPPPQPPPSGNNQ
jgi:hypothetical protein